MWFTGIVCYIWVLLLNSGYAYFSYSTRFEDEVSQHQLVRGFFVGTSPNSSFAARINDNHDYPASAHTIEFPRGFLDNAVHPVFTLLPNLTHNERALWSNGAQYIFYLTPEESHSAPYGTWLVGSTIGVDSGMAFLKPKHATAVAVSSSDSWNYHDGASWKPFPLPIKNSHVVSLSVASVSMLHSMQRTEMTSSYVLWKLPDLGIASHLSTLLRSLGITSSPPSASDHYPVYWDAASSTWTSFVVSHAVPYAYPLLALASHSQSEEDVAIYHLIADEFYSSYWRLFLRSSDAGDEVTYTLHFSPDGVFDPDEKKSIKLVSLSSYDQAIYNEYTTQRLDSVAAGDYIWLWQRTSNSIESLFLRAAYVNDSAIVFHIYPTHRTELLQRSQLQHATELLVARAEYDGYGFYRDSEAVDVISLFHIPLVTSWLYQHLTVHEGFVADDISSCFLYHAAVVMPEQLVYAAEMMCLLMGAKSVSMVKFADECLFTICRFNTQLRAITKRISPSFRPFLIIFLVTLRRSRCWDRN